MASGTLYTYPENFRAYKILIAAKYSGAHVKVSPDFVFGETNKSEKFLKKFPLGKVPAFESDDGKFLLTESNAIAYFVANKQLTGSTPVDEALILQWLSFADSEILPASCAWVFPVLGILPINKQVPNQVIAEISLKMKATERAKEDVKAALNVLNAHLLHNTYLVGERITLADICIACTLLHLYQNVLDPNFRKPFQNVNRWFMTIINQPQVKQVLGEIKLCEKVTEADPKKYAEMQGILKGGQQGKDASKDKKKESKKEPTPKKEDKKQENEEMDETELALAAEPKAKDPFEGMPKGNFDMDGFKRVYSNEEVDKSIPYFWEKFDSENYSIWFSEYKYPDELQKIFMSCNLITGMFQRLEKLRKNAFASVCLFGVDNDSSISGVWVFRGQNLAFELCPDWQVDYESYEWKKLDPKDPKTKELVDQYLSWEGTDKNGRKFNQGKIFK